ncbi:MAG TPA: beta-galactosidase [Candidatus Saccharimonadales bacterium]|nr:beta-galactosidase [Candidatus Saccharimonadales bacterium]
MSEFGVSFSVKQCRKFGVDPQSVLDWLLGEGNFRRFRIMSYWNEHEPQPGKSTFKELDWQLDRIAKAGGTVTLCLGARQPRWPENHWPDWAWQLEKPERSAALLRYIASVVDRYKNHPALASYQLENEALFVNFGSRAEVDVPRLVQEFELVKKLDPHHPVIMSVSDPRGIPLRAPVPDIIGFSYYHRLYEKGKYRSAHHYWWWHWARARAIKLVKRRPTFIHELQLEPWGVKDIWEMSIEEQDKSAGPARLGRNIRLAKRTRLTPIDLWGGEWWYWRLHTLHDPSIWQAVKTALGPQHFLTR